MKFSAATLVLASVAYSQTIQSEMAMLPSCSLTCLQNAITGAGCSITDYSCQCGSAKNAITTAATPCVIGACTTNDALKVQSITNEICTLVAAGSGGASSATSSAASSATSASGASSAITSAASSVTSVASSASSKASSAASSASSEASSAASSATSAAASATSSTPVQATGGASRMEAAGAVVGAAVLAAFAL